MPEGPVVLCTFLDPEGTNKTYVSVQHWITEVARGKVSGVSSLSKFGVNRSVGATSEDVWENGGSYTYPGSANIVNVTSTDTKDRDSSSGARTVQLYGLDASYDEINETVSLSGATAVPTSNSYIRLFRAIVRSAGSDGANQGTIQMIDSSSSATLATITTPHNQTLMTHWTVPAGKTFYLTELWLSDVTAKITDIDVMVRPFGEVFQTKRTLTINGSSNSFPLCAPIKVEEKSDIVIRAAATGGGGNVSAGYCGWYE